MRLDKYLASCTGMTRKEIKKALKKTPAVVGGLKISAPETQVDQNSTVYFQGERLEYSEFTYIIMNKPAGYVCTNREGRNPTVFSILDQRLQAKSLFTVGRLDKDTTGLLIITDDGDFSHRLMHAKKHVLKTYHLITDVEIPESAIEQFAAGVDIGDEELTKPAVLRILPDHRSALLTISEGRFHQVKRMMEAVGCTVTELDRISVGDFTLEKGPAPGGYRSFDEAELALVDQIRNS